MVIGKCYKKELLNKVESLIQIWQTGYLGGEKMPEDENPGYQKIL